MVTEDLHIDDKVWQKTGGPEMKVVAAKKLSALPNPTVVGTATCEWQSEGKTQEGTFTLSELTKTKPLDLKTELAHFKSSIICQQRSTLGELRDWLRPAWDECEEFHRYDARDVKDRIYYLDEYLKLKPKFGDDLLEHRCREVEADLACVLRMIDQYGRDKLVSDVMKETGE